MATKTSQLAHMVYFTLYERTDANITRLMAACREFLSGHPGTVYFGVGRVAPGLERPVNVRDFDVALQLVFESREAHDAYQVAPRHVQFVEQNKANWSQVRVFDAAIES
jgi:hypothetical protein